MRTAGAVFWLVAVLGCGGRSHPDGGTDAGRACEDWDDGDAWANFTLTLESCSAPDASVWFDVRDAITLTDPDGGRVDFGIGCFDGSCECNLACDAYGFAQLGSGDRVLIHWTGEVGGAPSVCPVGSPDVCHPLEPAPPGVYRARFCASQSVVRDSYGLPSALGPVTCVDRPFNVPFDRGGVHALLP